MSPKCLVSLIVLISFTSCLAIDLDYTDISPVTDETRFTTLNPNVNLVPFNKVHNVKGNIIFTAGERINGDKLILTLLDKAQFAKAEDIEVIHKYPAKGQNGFTLTCITCYVDPATDDADAYIFNGGIDSSYAEVLMTCDQTKSFTYECFYYGY